MEQDYHQHRKRTLSYSFPKTFGAFVRELLAVTALLTLQERAMAYDFFTPGLVLFLVLIAFRAPYINSYTFLFEASSIDTWSIRNHVGNLQPHLDPTQNWLHIISVLVAHIGGAYAAAALRVYFDVTYGKEIMSTQPALTPALEVDITGLTRFDPFWGAGQRLNRLAAASAFNGTAEATLPLGTGALGIDPSAIKWWYMIEEVGYVLLLCGCYIHIWLAAGVADNKQPPMNPFKPIYWKNLFSVACLVTAISFALYRAFPTAHGSLHKSIFLYQYQEWNPNVRVHDSENGEISWRVVGGVLGTVLAVIYNKMLVSTEKRDANDITDTYYRLLWGMDRDESHTKAERVRGQEHPSYTTPATTAADTQQQQHTQPLYRRKRCDCGSCAQCAQQNPDFKLRIPYMMNHPK